MKFNLDIPRMGYFLVLKSTGGWFGNMIEKRQRQEGFSEDDSKYTHVEVMGGGQYSVRVAPPKTKIIDITKQYKGRYIKIVKYKAKDYDSKRYKVAFWAASFNNLAYDKKGVLAFLGWFRKWLKHSKNLYFCSEMSLTALQREYPKALLSLPPNDAMPAHFLGDEFKIVWEGTVE